MCPLGWFISLLQKVFFIQKNESQRVFWRDDYISTKFGCILRFVGSRRDVDCFLPAQKNYIFEIREFCLTQKHNFRHAVKGRLEKFDIRQTIHISVWGSQLRNISLGQPGNFTVMQHLHSLWFALPAVTGGNAVARPFICWYPIGRKPSKIP